MKNRKLVTGYLLVILSAFLFGCMPLITTRIYAQGIERESVVLLRNMLSLPVLGLLAFIQSKSLKIPVKSLPAIGGIALMGCCVTPLLLYASYQQIDSGPATVFHFVYPAVVVLVGLIFLKKKLNLGTALSVLLCFAGICLFYDLRQPMNWTGCGLALASGVTYAVYVVLLSVFRYKEVSGFKLSFYVSLVCTVVMLAVCLISGKLTMPTNLAGWLLCILLALVINVGAVVMFQRGTFLIGGEQSSILSAVEPLTGVVIGIVVLGDKPTVGTVIGSVLVIASSVLIAIFDAKQSKKQEK